MAKRGIAGPPPPPLGLPLLGKGGPSVLTRTTSSRGNVDVLIAVAGLNTVLSGPALRLCAIARAVRAREHLAVEGVALVRARLISVLGPP